jgi:tetratricopeptide (TPR) repeat protein
VVSQQHGPAEDSPDRPAAPAPEYGTHSELSGSASDVVQARDVHGGVHFHGPTRYEPTSVPQQLPTDVQGFVNRHHELGLLHDVMSDAKGAMRLLVITGTAGVGKTCIALRFAHTIRDRFPDGQLYADLRGYDPHAPVTAEQVLARFLRALDVPATQIPVDAEGMAALFRSRLAGRRLLVLLDNAATVAQVRPVLPATPGCLAVVTSRNRLSGLTVREGARRITVNVLNEEEAISLLCAVTAKDRPQDAPEELRQLARLCARLPLALRIAAERAASRPHMPLHELIEDLRDESSLWDALSTHDDEEADAVRSVFAWSYRALPAEAAQLFRRLGLHPGPEFSDHAAAALTATTTRRVRRLLDTLVGTHMVEQVAPDRYRFHDLLRAYAQEQAEHDEPPVACAQARQRVLGWYLHCADAAQAQIAPHEARLPLDPLDSDITPLTFSGYDEAIHWYEAERDNLVAATGTAARTGLHRLSWQLAIVLRAIFMGLNPFQDWLATSRIGLESARLDGERHAEAELQESLGMAYTQAGQLDMGEHHYQAALTIRRELADDRGEALTLNGLGLLQLRRRELVRARTSIELSLEKFRAIGDAYWATIMSMNLAGIAAELGSTATAERLANGALTTLRNQGNKRAEGNALRILSAISLESGEPESALSYAQHAMEIALDLDNAVAEGYWLLDLARAQRAVGQPGEALASYHRAALLQRQLGDRAREALAWDGTGETYRELGRPQEAIDFHRRAIEAFQALRDDWHAARALDHLAAALVEINATEDAAHHRRRARDLLRDLDDPKANALRDRLEAALGNG